ncbi:hypothetical protein Q8A73_003808 [Channa argus]|nr:hypothetical protein Q8A73_003808 [Channa argus]
MISAPATTSPNTNLLEKSREGGGGGGREGGRGKNRFSRQFAGGYSGTWMVSCRKAVPQAPSLGRFDVLLLSFEVEKCGLCFLFVGEKCDLTPPVIYIGTEPASSESEEELRSSPAAFRE